MLLQLQDSDSLAMNEQNGMCGNKRICQELHQLQNHFFFPTRQRKNRIYMVDWLIVVNILLNRKTNIFVDFMDFHQR